MALALNTSDPLHSALSYLLVVDDDNTVKELKGGRTLTVNSNVVINHTTAPFGRSFRTGGASSVAWLVSHAAVSAPTNAPISVFIACQQFTSKTNPAGSGTGARLFAGEGGAVKIGPGTHIFIDGKFQPSSNQSGASAVVPTAGNIATGANTFGWTRYGTTTPAKAYINGALDSNYTSPPADDGVNYNSRTAASTFTGFGGMTTDWVTADWVYVAVFIGTALTADDFSRLHASLTGSNAFALIDEGVVLVPPVLTGTVSISEVATTGAMLAWSAATGATSYEVSVDGGTTWSIIGLTVPYVTLTGQTPGTTYTPKVRARNDNGLSAVISSSPTTYTTLEADPPDGILGADVPAIGTHGPALLYAWLQENPAYLTDLVRIEITVMPVSGTLVVYPDTSFSFTPVVNGTYTATFQPYVNDVATGSPLTATLYSGTEPADIVAPTMVGSISVTLLTATTYTTSISAATDNVAVTGYQVSEDGGSTWIEKSTARTHNHTGRTPEATDQVRWRARDAAGNLATPLATSVTMPAAPDTTAPVMTGGITVTLIAQTSYTSSIEAATDNVGVTGYQVSEDGGSTWFDKGASRTHNHTGRTPEATDQVRWRARDAAGNQATPLSTSVTLLSVPDTTAPVMAGSITVTSVTSTSYTTSVDAATDNVAVTAYQVSQDGGATWIAKGTSRTHDHSGRTPSTTDQVRWRAGDAAGNWATPLSAAVVLSAPPDVTAPVMVGVISVTLLEPTSYTTAIQAATDSVGVTGYAVSEDGGSTWTDMGTARTRSHTGRTPETSDVVQWRARDVAGNLATPLTTTVTLPAVPGPLVVEDGSAKVDAESYASVEQANVYFSAHGYEDWATKTETEKQVALRLATGYMVGEYGQRWPGYRTTTTQALDWPRYEVEIRDTWGGAYLPSDQVPVAVRNACILLALKASAGELAPDVQPLGAVTEETVGPITVKRAETSRTVVRYRAIDQMLASLLKGGGGLRVVRA
ncbi:MAG: DnaT-like ssDNA-binding protein [Pseudomonadota bacterium]